MSCCTGDFVSVHHWELPLDAEICPNELLSHPERDRSSATKNRRQVPIGPATPLTSPLQPSVQYPRG